MWTPKRIVMLVCGFAFFLGSYRIYAAFLGGIDGLPPLPEAYWPKGPTSEIKPPQEPQANQKLRMAFGEECPELDFPIKLEAHQKGVILASRAFFFEDGRIRLTPISLVLFNKKILPDKFPEITTIRGAVAYVTFDKPVSSLADIDNRRIVGCELIGKVKTDDPLKEAGNGIEVVNNRGTPGRDDDMVVFLARGPVYYREFLPQQLKQPDRKPEIWSDDAVELTDYQSKPLPSTVKAAGLEIYLTNNPNVRTTAQPPAKKPRPDQVTGVERVVLRSAVKMHLFVDAQSGFLTSSKEAKEGSGKKKPGPEPKAEKSQVVITTHGPFTYDVIKDHAVFQVPANPGGKFPEQIHVSRYQELDKRDHLICEHLELQFRRKPSDKKPGAAEGDKENSGSLEIENAHATGKEVVLSSDAEMLEAHGNDFFYNALTQQTTLKGEPEMWALKEGNEIHARELQITNQKGAQQGTAIGPGRIDMLDKKTGKRTLHARWRDKLVTTRDGKQDLLILMGDAAFSDDDQGQELKAETLKVWLDARDAKGPESDPSRPEPRGGKPHHVEAIGRVQARSRELTVHDTDRLVLWFKDSPGPIAVPAPPVGPPAPASPPAPVKPSATDGQPKPTPAPAHSVNKPASPEMPSPPPQPALPQPKPIPPAATAGAPAKPAPDKPDKPDKPARPIDLSARVVEAHLTRTGEKNELDRLWTEGTVRVKQEGATPTDRGVDIQGDTLQLTRTPDGNIIVVTGDLAQLRLDKLLILGPEVNIDQSTNKAWVNGTGAMQIDSDRNFQGGKLKQVVPLTIHWNKSMFFNGQHAEFHGGIQAEQENARLACQSLQVELDRPVSLKENEKRQGEQPARVQQLVCDKSVRVEDTILENGSLVRYQRSESTTLVLDNTEGRANASGPGLVRIFQPSASDPKAALATGAKPGAAKPNAKPNDQETKLTRIRYFGSMYANNKTHTATFRDNVELVHVSADDPNLDPNVDKLPPEGLYIRSDMLTVYTREENGKTTQEMQAKGKKVVVRTNEFFADCAEVHYHEGKDQIILDGGNGGLVHLSRLIKPGEYQTSTAQKVIYSRKTGQFEFIGGRDIRSGN